MRTVAFMPIKLNSVRLKNKNILDIARHPMCWHMAQRLLEVREIDDVYVFCSDENIMKYLPDGIKFLKRDKSLDADLVKGSEIYKSFIECVDADYYVLAHATSPFIKAETIRNSLCNVISGAFDSAFTVKKIQNFAWYDDAPINYSLEDVPRTQDLKPILIETSAFFIFKKELFVSTNRRIGFNPYIQEVIGSETIDIDTKEDFMLAEAYASILLDNE